MSGLDSDSPSLAGGIDTTFPAETSVVCRYRGLFAFGEPDADAAFKRALVSMSVQEGARVFLLGTYRGVEIHLLDESSLMHTGTLKSIDGCLAAAKCRVSGCERVVFESGGNTGNALTAYGQRAGVETFCVVPAENLPLLDGATFAAAGAHLIAAGERALVKPAARLLADLDGARHIPDLSWRYEAARFRGAFVLDHILARGPFDWMAQTISAAFGPIGIYDVVRRFAPPGMRPPRFLGVQQAANCPMYTAWQSERGLAGSAPAGAAHEELLTRVMYDATPQTYGTYDDLKGILAATSGSMTTIARAEFDEALERPFEGGRLIDLLADRGARIGTRDGDVVERTGLIAIAGTLKAIDTGAIAPGSRVLCCLTSGTKPGDGRAVPDLVINDLESARDQLRNLVARG
jgi:hypothetical protein